MPLRCSHRRARRRPRGLWRREHRGSPASQLADNWALPTSSRVLRRSPPARARAPFGAERSRRRRRWSRARRAVRDGGGGSGRVLGRRAALRTAWCRARDRWWTTTVTTRRRSRRCWRRRAAKPARVVVAFQPHRYTRTRDLMQVRDGARRRRRGGAHRHLRGERRSDSGCQRGHACLCRQRRPSPTGARRARRSRGAGRAGRARETRRSGDHARCRLDRRDAAKVVEALDERSGRGRVRGRPLSACVAARRTSGSAGRTSSPVASAAPLRAVWTVTRGVIVFGLMTYGGWRGTTLVLGAPALQISRVVRSSRRLATGEAWHWCRSCAYRILTISLDDAHARLLSSPLDRGGHAAADAAADRRDRHPGASADGIGRVANGLYLVDPTGVIVDGKTILTCRSSTVWRRCRTRERRSSTSRGRALPLA